MTSNLIFSIIAACVSVGGVFIAIGMFKAKINQNTEANKTQDKQIETLASKNELAAAIKRSDEMLAMMRERADEDRSKGQGQYREFHSILSGQDKRIIKLETQQDALGKSLSELKNDIKSGFKEMQNELKELQNEIKTMGRRN